MHDQYGAVACKCVVTERMVRTHRDIQALQVVKLAISKADFSTGRVDVPEYSL